MTDKTWDEEDARDLPYRFLWSPITQEVLIVSRGAVTAFFENREAFHRFLVEGNNLEIEIQDRVISETLRILKDKQGS